MDETSSDGLRPPAPRRRRWGVGAGVALLLAGVALWVAWPPAAPPPVTLADPAPLAVPPGPVAPAASEPVAGPLPPEPAAPPAPLAADALEPALEALVGPAAMRLLQRDRLALRIVATVDNLAREQASAGLRPVLPAAGRFAVLERADGRTVVAPDNAARYAAIVGLIDALDARAVVALYRRALPALQAAYADLGHPKARFHDRVVQVIDHLLATPEAPSPLVLTLTDVKGEVPSVRPWVRWEYADPALERASAGRKILWRVGPEHAARLKAKLRELRAELARP